MIAPGTAVSRRRRLAGSGLELHHLVIMRLVLAWLLGVPAPVGSMVLARASFLPEHKTSLPPTSIESTGSADCPGHPDNDTVTRPVTPQLQRVTCKGLSIH